MRPLKRTHFKRSRPLRLVLPLLSMLAFAAPAAAVQCSGDHDHTQSGLTKAMEATLVVAGADRDQRFLGSAVLWRDGRFAVTAAHVVGERRKVRLRNALGFEVIAEVVILDAARDVAFVKLTRAVMGDGLEPRLSALRVGETVYAIGAPFEAEQTLTAGVVSATRRQVDPAVPVYMIQHDAAINAGSSGGPLVDRDGHLVGINAELDKGSRFFTGIAYALNARTLSDVFDGVLNDVPVLGLRMRPVDPLIAEALGLDSVDGMLVDYVMPGGAADAAGLKPGDILMSVDGKAITREGDFALLLDARSEPMVTLGLMRGKRQIEVILRFATDEIDLIMGKTQVAGFSAVRRASTTLKKLGVIITGRRVTELVPTSPAYLAGLSVGDEILAIDGVPVREQGFVWPDLDGPVVLLVRTRTGQTRHIVFDPFSNDQGMRPIGGAVVLDPAVITL